jgi:hypothetical protein
MKALLIEEQIVDGPLDFSHGFSRPLRRILLPSGMSIAEDRGSIYAFSFKSQQAGKDYVLLTEVEVPDELEDWAQNYCELKEKMYEIIIPFQKTTRENYLDFLNTQYAWQNLGDLEKQTIGAVPEFASRLTPKISELPTRIIEALYKFTQEEHLSSDSLRLVATYVEQMLASENGIQDSLFEDVFITLVQENSNSNIIPYLGTRGAELLKERSSSLSSHAS